MSKRHSKHQQERQPHRIYIIVGAVLLTLFLMREGGIIDLNAYTSTAVTRTTMETTTKHTSRFGWRSASSIAAAKANPGYQLSILRGRDTLDVIQEDDNPGRVLEASFEKIAWSGATALPFAKIFELDFEVVVRTVKDPFGSEFTARIKGTVDFKALGVCTTTQAKNLALEHARETMVKQIQKAIARWINPEADQSVASAIMLSER